MSAPDKVAQAGHQVLHRLCLGREFLRSAGTFFGAGGIALGHFFHLSDAAIDLLDALGLLPGRIGDVGNQRICRGHAVGDLAE